MGGTIFDGSANPKELQIEHGFAGAITDTATQARRLLLVALVPTAITLVYEWTTGTMPANWIRALAGLPLGASVAWLIGTLNVERDPEP